MDDKTFFLGKWQFKDTLGSAMYPEGGTAAIAPEGTEFKISWKDSATQEHVLHHLKLASGKLIGPAEDKDGFSWIVTIERNGTSKNLQGAIAPAFTLAPNGFVESNLAGTWGAEAPPPVKEDGEGKGGAGQ